VDILLGVFDENQGLRNKKIINSLFNCINTCSEIFIKFQDQMKVEDYDRLFVGLEKMNKCFSKKQEEYLLKLKEKDFSIILSGWESNEQETESIYRRLQVAETVLSKRTNRIIIVLERCYDYHNQLAVLRTAECLGVQNVWIVIPVETKNFHMSKKITRGNEFYLTIRKFKTSTECLEALREDKREIWATALSPGAINLESECKEIPEKLAIVFGREADGCSQEMLQAADKNVYLPIFGFTESLNLSVAAALILQQLFVICPESIGQMSNEDRQILRKKWYEKLSGNNLDYEQYLNNPPPILDDLRRNEEIKHEFIE